MPRLLVEKGPDRGKSLPIIAGKPLIAGRDAAADLQLSDYMASRRHFKIANKGEKWGLVDLNSANGTLVNGKKSDGAVRLQIGDSIQIGETLISFLAEEKEDRSGLIGQQIGGYLVEERLGRGAMGTVYKAVQLSLSRTIALKVLSQDLVKDEKFCEMFVKEARAAGGLNHPNIVQVYDVGDEAGQYFFSMEYAEKGSVLEEMGKGGSLDMSRAIEVIKLTCAALDYGERKGLVHRDIKPDNLMVMEDGAVKLGDLGLAMSGKETEEQQDGVFGTPHYIAPEQAMGKPVDHRADIYALGATFYRMVSGRTLYTGTTVKEILKKQVREPHEPITTHVPDCPTAISNIIDRMLAKEPSERYQHASDILNDIANYEALSSRQGDVISGTFGERLGGLTAEQSQQIAQINATRNLLIAAVVAVIALVLAGVSIYVFAFSGGQSDNNTVAQSDNRPVAANTPAGKTPKVDELPAGVKQANEKLNNALIRASVHADLGTTKGFEDAIDLLGNALPKHPRAEAGVKSKVNKAIVDYETKISSIREVAGQFDNEFEEIKRTNHSQIEEYKYDEARKTVRVFVTRLQKDKSDAAKDLLSYVESYASKTLPSLIQRHQNTFIKNTNAKKKKSNGERASVRLPIIQALIGDVQAAIEKCDNKKAKKLFVALEEDLKKLKSILLNASKNAEKMAEEIAYNNASRTLSTTLAVVREHVSLGRFGKAEKELKQFETENNDFRRYGKGKMFSPIVEDIRLRRKQSEYEMSAIRNFARAVSFSKLHEILKAEPWPAEFSKIVGGEKTLFLIRVTSSSDQLWELEVIPDPSKASERNTKKASDFNTPAMRRALGQAIGHILLSSDIIDDLDKPMSKGDPSVLLGICAWVLELGAYGEAYDIIKYRYDKIKENASDYKITREYFAFGLLAKSMQLAKDGDSSGAEAILAKLEGEFSDTRAAKGRK